jgi:hypothetical protein
METGTPCSLTISHTYISTSLSRESVILMGRKWALFVSLSIMAHSYLIPFPHWHFERLKLSNWPLVFSFYKLTRKALCNILNYITLHATLAKFPFSNSVHLVVTWVNCILCLMSFIKNISPQLSIIRDNKILQLTIIFLCLSDAVHT